MAATLQSQAIDATNSGINAAQTLMTLYVQLVHVQNVWQDMNVGQTLTAMNTVALNADGSMGAADASPNANHPIDTTKYPTLSRSLSSTQIAQIKTILDGVVSYINGTAVTTQPGARAILNAAIGG
jgi:hypothetical protein